MPQTQDTHENVDPVGEFAPMPSSIHINLTDRVAPVAQERSSVRPLAPWRWVALAIAVLLAITYGPAAAAPVWNTADLLVFVGLGIVVAAFVPGRNHS